MPAKPRYRAWFESFNNPEERYELDEVVYSDSQGGLLQVCHDTKELAKTPADEWKRLFEERSHRNVWPHGSGVWGKKEWVLPELHSENVVSMYEGNTNLFWAERYGRELGLEDLWIKLCGNTHTGSFKDLGMTVLVSMVKELRARGKPVRAVACASTGDTSAALAAYAAAADIPAIVFLPRGRISTAQLIQPIANGAVVFAIDSDFDGCMEIVRRLAEREGVYLANSMNSLRIEGQKTVGIEVVQQFDWEVPDWVVIPGGNLGNVSALAKGFDMMLELGLIARAPRILCAQAAQANPLYLSYQRDFEVFEAVAARPTLASAIQIGNPVSWPKAVAALRRYDGVVEQATESELIEEAARADRTGLFNCPHTGVALAALRKCVAAGTIHKSDRVVVISTAHGLKFVDSKVRYHNMEIEGVIASQPNPQIELPADYDQVRERMLREIELRFGDGGSGGGGGG